jgi:hypothetical protein
MNDYFKCNSNFIQLDDLRKQRKKTGGKSFFFNKNVMQFYNYGKNIVLIEHFLIFFMNI